jgi:hypothetical protein
MKVAPRTLASGAVCGEARRWFACGAERVQGKWKRRRQANKANESGVILQSTTNVGNIEKEKKPT